MEIARVLVRARLARGRSPNGKRSCVRVAAIAPLPSGSSGSRDGSSCIRRGEKEHLALDTTVDPRTVALYWDFENLHAALFEQKNGEG